MIRTVVGVTFIALIIVFILPFLILSTWISGSADFMFEMAMKSLRIFLRIVGVRVRTEGAENIPARPCVFVSNHVSNLDPPALVPYIPRRVAILAKKEVFRIPILSIGFHQVGVIPVDRGDTESAAASVDAAIQSLRNGRSFLVFAEGTRSRDGRLRRFKNGTFLMAIRAGAAVVPVSLIGTQRLMRKGEWYIRPGEVVVRFGPFVDAAQYSLDGREQLRNRIHDLVAENLPPDQAPEP
jgi:1-acyl-sn-glycerol-3-phosphate acyltransferase